MRKLLILFCFLNFIGARSQNADSLYKVWYDTSKPDTARLKAIHALVWMYMFESPDSSLLLGEKELALAKKTNNKKAEANALKYINKALYVKSNYPVALEYTLKYLKINEELGDKRGIADAFNMLGNLYYAQREYERSLDYHKRSLKLKLETGYKEGIAGSYNNIGNVYFEKNDLRQAILNFEKALRIFEDMGQTQNVAGANINIADVHLQLNELEKAMEHLAVTKKISEEAGDKAMLSNVYGIQGRIYLKQKNLQQARLSCEEGLKLAKELNLVSETAGNCECLYNVYDAIGDYKKAFEYHKQFIEVRDTLRSEDRAKEITGKIFQFKYDKKVAADSIRNAQTQKIKDTEQRAELQQEATKRYALYVIVALIGVFALLIFNRFKITQRQNKVIETQKAEVETQKHIIEEKNKEVMDSIHYAKRIQSTILAHTDFVNANIPSNFIYFKPKDIVSGDFYWASRKDDLFYLAVCDSTGHGVPGAFMSLLNIGFLSEAINEKNIKKPNEIFNYVRERLVNSISKEGQRDGFDGILICIDTKTKKLTYAAANNDPLIISEDEIRELPANRMPVGIGVIEAPFELYEAQLKQGEILYLYTDGFADQFGGPKGKKYKYKQLNQFLQSIVNKPIPEQASLLDEAFEGWRGQLEQVDDVCIVGIRI